MLDIAYIHPTLLLSLSDHLHRQKSLNLSNESNIGLILGKSSNKNISLLYSFQISISEQSNTESFKQHLSLLNEIYGNNYLQLIGFYIIDNENNNFDKLDNQLNLLRKIYINNNYNNNNRGNILSTSIDLNNMIYLNYSNSEIFIYSIQNNKDKIPYEIRYLDAEKISISTYNTIPKIPINNENDINYNEENNENDNNNQINLAMNDLNEKLNNALIFLNQIKTGKINIHQNNQSYQTFQSLSDLAGQISALKSKLKSEIQITNDKSSEIEKLNNLIALTSLTSSIFCENFNNSI